MMFLPEKLASDQDKDEFATTARLICIAHNAAACVMALEAWMKTAQPDEKLDTTEPAEGVNDTASRDKTIRAVVSASFTMN